MICEKGKIDAFALFVIYASKYFLRETNNWKTFTNDEIEHFVNILNKNDYKYGYRLLELYKFENYRGDISETMLIIINSI